MCFTNQALCSDGWCIICKSMDHSKDTCPLRPIGQQFQAKRRLCAALMPGLEQTGVLYELQLRRGMPFRTCVCKMPTAGLCGHQVYTTQETILRTVPMTNFDRALYLSSIQPCLHVMKPSYRPNSPTTNI